MTQKDAFNHKNYLDVNELLKDKEMDERWEGVDYDSPLMKARKRIINN